MENPEVTLKQRLEIYLSTLEKINTIFYSPKFSWELKYGEVFNLAPRLRISGLFNEYEDPDTSYQEDVTAFVRAANLVSMSYQKAYSELQAQNLLN